jgi:hypothetical protein
MDNPGYPRNRLRADFHSINRQARVMSSLIADGAVHGGREAAADVMEELQLSDVDHQGGESTAPVAVGRDVIDDCCS